MSQQRTQAVNVEQTRAWDGADGDNWVELEDWYNQAQRYITPPLFDGAAIVPADSVLDVGCGCGETTRVAARTATSGSALGIDLSSQMIERARQRAAGEGIANARFERGDVQIYPFAPGSFDVAISRFGAMFFDDPVRAFINIARAITSDGRIAMLFWRELGRNEWVLSIRDALAAGRNLPEPPPGVPGPFAFADENHVRGILEHVGFASITIEPVDAPLSMGSNAGDSFESVQRLGIVRGLLGDLEGGARTSALNKLRHSIEDHETPEGVLFGASAWLVRAVNARGGKERP